MPNNKELATEGATTDLTSPREALQANRDVSQEREARDAALAHLVAEAVAREMSKAHVQYTTMMKVRMPGFSTKIMRSSFLLLSLFRNSSPCSTFWRGRYSVGSYDLGNVVNVVRRYEIFVRVLHSSEVTILRLCK